MILPVSENLTALAESCSFPLYIVGGFVRDCLAGLKCEHADLDICAPAGADAFIASAQKCGAVVSAVYRNTGTVKLKLNGEEYEYTSFRSDEYVRGTHTPVKTFFTDDIRLDALRRDFKCNAVYYDIKNGVAVDPLGGINDIKLRKITTVAQADKVFGEDGLRLMRLARQSAQTGFVPDGECIDGAKNNRKLICDISPERIFAELNAILLADGRYGTADAQYMGLKLLDVTRVLDSIIPELTAGRDMLQPEQYHKYDVLEHSLVTVKYAHPSVRLSALLHDAGKPYCMNTAGNYHGHEKESAHIACEFLSRMKAPKKLIRETVDLCSAHMYDSRCDARESKVRKFIVKNYGVYEKLLLLKQADFSACRDCTDEAPGVKKLREVHKRMIEEGVPFSLKQLNVRGDELISAGVKAERTGEILETLLYDCVTEPRLNKKDVLIKRALKIV